MLVTRRECLQDDLLYSPYRYTAIITNMDLPLEEQTGWYRQRGQWESRTQELKWEFELRVLPSGGLSVNVTCLRIIALAYNLFIARKTLTLSEPDKALRLKIVLFCLPALPALVVHHARQLLCKLTRGHPHRAEFQASYAAAMLTAAENRRPLKAEFNTTRRNRPPSGGFRGLRELPLFADYPI